MNMMTGAWINPCGLPALLSKVSQKWLLHVNVASPTPSPSQEVSVLKCEQTLLSCEHVGVTGV